MCAKYSPTDDESLLACLRKEAEQMRPAFSEELHRRVWDSIEQLRAERLPAARSTPGRTARWALAAAAATVLLGAIGWHELVSRSRPEERLSAGARGGLVLLTDLAHYGAQQVDRLASAAVLAQERESLDHDMRLAARTLAEESPFLKRRGRALSP